LVVNGSVVSNAATTSYDQNGIQLSYDSNVGVVSSSNASGGAISFRTNPAAGFTAERLRIDSSGNVGIGVTSPSANGLEISKTAGNNSGVKITSGTQSSEIVVNSGAGFYVTNNSTTLPTMFWTNGTERLRITSDGNVGIGITSPAYKFVVSNAGAQGLEVQTTSSSLIDLHSYNRTTSSYTDTKVNCSSFIVAIGTSSATERLRIDSFGNVGIGVSTPVNKLEIVGSFGRGAPVTKTADFSLADTENWLIVNKGSSCTVTLPAASSWTGREFTIKVITAHTVVSASSNIIPRIGGAAATAILPATDGAWATLVSNGTTLSYSYPDRANNLAGGNANEIPYQSASNTTAFIAPGVTGQVLKATTGAAPSWGPDDITIGIWGTVIGRTNEYLSTGVVCGNAGAKHTIHVATI
jgi:hypothetical protein